MRALGVDARSRRARRAGWLSHSCADRARLAAGADRDLVELARWPGCRRRSPAVLCWLTSSVPAVGGEHDPGGPELEPVELRVLQPDRRLAAARRHPPDRRVVVVGDVERAVRAPGGVVGDRVGGERRPGALPARCGGSGSAPAPGPCRAGSAGRASRWSRPGRRGRPRGPGRRSSTSAAARRVRVYSNTREGTVSPLGFV